MATTRNPQSLRVDFPERITSVAAPCPQAFLEYAWYVSLTYAMLGGAWGIVIPSIGGAILVIIAVACFFSVSGQASRLYKPVRWALYTGAFLIVIQLLFHQADESALSEGIDFVGWLALLIIAQALSLRPGFMQRFALVALAIGVASLPYLNFKSVDGIMRAWASGTGISNPNVLGMWFGFCTVYFVFWGLQCRKPMLKVISWAVAVGCLYVVLLSVSRAPLLAIVIACIVGLRSELKRSFVPLLMLAVLISLVYVSGVFDTEIDYYTARGAEESGRGKLWPRAIDRILDSPWIGVGLGDIRILTNDGRFVPPHNGLFHIALGGGIVPLICFLGYIARVVIGALRIMQRGYVGETAILPPLVVFGLLEIMMLDLVFMSSWVVVVFGMAASARRNPVPS